MQISVENTSQIKLSLQKNNNFSDTKEVMTKMAGLRVTRIALRVLHNVNEL